MSSQLVLTPVATDNFNRANGTIAGSNNWLATSETSLAISSNVAVGTAAAQRGDYRSDTYSSNHYSTITLATSSLTSNDYIGASVRNQDNQNNYSLLYFNNGGTYEIDFYKRVAGSYSQLGVSYTTGFSGPLTAGTTLTLLVEGSQLTILINGAFFASIRDTTFTTGGTPGILSFGAESLDNWAGGNAATGAIGAAIASDAFTRANAGMSVGQANWAILTGYPAVDIPIVSNQLSASTGTHAADVRTDAFNLDHWSAIQMGSSFITRPGFVGALTRINPAGDSGYLGVLFGQGIDFRIYRLDAGSSTLLATTQSVPDASGAQLGVASAMNPAGTSYTLVSEGSRHSLRVNGAEILVATDSTYASGQPGIMLFPVATADNWSTGPVATVSPPVNIPPLGGVVNVGASGGTVHIPTRSGTVVLPGVGGDIV